MEKDKTHTYYLIEYFTFCTKKFSNDLTKIFNALCANQILFNIITIISQNLTFEKWTKQ